MLRLLSDENFNGEVIRGLFRAQADLDLVRVQDVGLIGADDPAILAWASANNRVLLTHDRATVPAFAQNRLRGGELMPGVFVIENRAPLENGLSAGRFGLARHRTVSCVNTRKPTTSNQLASALRRWTIRGNAPLAAGREKNHSYRGLDETGDHTCPCGGCP